MTTIDLNADGKIDIAVANAGGGSISILRNTMSGSTLSFFKQDIAVGTNPVNIASGDLNEDGKPDIAVANSGSNTISLLQNTSSGGGISFGPKSDKITATNPVNLVIGNLDGDGLPDLAVANAGSGSIYTFRVVSSQEHQVVKVIRE